MKALLCALALLLACVPGATFADSTRPRAEPSAEAQARRLLDRRQSLVLGIVDRQNKVLLGSEAYAAWESYRQEFQQRIGHEFAVLVVAPRAARRLLGRGLPVADAGTLFARSDGKALWVQGLVLEPQVYALALVFLRGGELPAEAASYGLGSIELSQRVGGSAAPAGKLR